MTSTYGIHSLTFQITPEKQNFLKLICKSSQSSSFRTYNIPLSIKSLCKFVWKSNEVIPVIAFQIYSDNSRDAEA
jgi:hypothetical protein